MMKTPRPALFLDRDGTLNVDTGYLYEPEKFAWIDGAIDCIKRFNARGWWVFVVTNQSGVGRGYYTEDDVHKLHAFMADELAKAGAHIDAFYHCPFHPEASVERYRKDSYDRKPKPGMLMQAMADFPVKREHSFLIGDGQRDVDAAHAAGVGGFLFTGGNLATFAEWALADFESGSR